jgi:DNA repair exonuclease SbcCD ATPase subunit
MNNPDDRPGGTEERPSLGAPRKRRLSPEERRRVARAAFLRPMGLFVVAIGGVFSALTLSWWVVVLTLATYAALIFLAARDQLFWAHVLEGRDYRLETRPALSREEAPLERRVRRLPHGETRRKAEEALELYRRTMVAIEESDDVARTVLDDTIPKLHGIAGRLVDVAERREEVAKSIMDLENHAGAPQREDLYADLPRLENELRSADEEISQTVEKLSPLRSRVVRVSVESDGAVQEAAARLNTDLDEMNLRLDALRSSTSPPEPPDQSALRAHLTILYW